MNKELEALENIKHYDTRVGLHEDDYKIIETALEDYKYLKSILTIEWFNNLTPEDKYEVFRIMGVLDLEVGETLELETKDHAFFNQITRMDIKDFE